MQYDLVVTSAFGVYQIGDLISDPAAVAAITTSQQFHYCVQVPHIGADTTAPVITTAASQTVAENTAFSITLTANESSVTWAKAGGADAALFTLSGAVLSMAAKDFEAPADANGDNAYVVTVTATDAAGNVSAPFTITVTVTDVVEVAKPVNSAVPTISGTAQVGQTLTASPGTWSNSPNAFAYQWNRNGTAIPGATTASYSPVTADVSKTLTVTVVANNAGGASLPTTSAATAAVTAAPSSSTPGQISSDFSDPNSLLPRV